MLLRSVIDGLDALLMACLLCTRVGVSLHTIRLGDVSDCNRLGDNCTTFGAYAPWCQYDVCWEAHYL
jgi:hypothetical protein